MPPFTTTPDKRKRSKTLLYVGGGLALLVLLVCVVFVIFGRSKAAGAQQGAPLDKAQLLAAHASQLHKDLTGFQ